MHCQGYGTSLALLRQEFDSSWMSDELIRYVKIIIVLSKVLRLLLQTAFFDESTAL